LGYAQVIAQIEGKVTPRAGTGRNKTSKLGNMPVDKKLGFPEMIALRGSHRFKMPSNVSLNR
jgi:hypothetical protein